MKIVDSTKTKTVPLGVLALLFLLMNTTHGHTHKCSYNEHTFALLLLHAGWPTHGSHPIRIYKSCPWTEMTVRTISRLKKNLSPVALL